jgi:hypothetical protein
MATGGFYNFYVFKEQWFTRVFLPGNKIWGWTLIRYTYMYDKNLEIIQPLVQELYNFLCFRFWPPGGQTKNQTGPKFGL